MTFLLFNNLQVDISYEFSPRNNFSLDLSHLWLISRKNNEIISVNSIMLFWRLMRLKIIKNQNKARMLVDAYWERSVYGKLIWWKGDLNISTRLTASLNFPFFHSLRVLEEIFDIKQNENLFLRLSSWLWNCRNLFNFSLTSKVFPFCG